MASLYGALDSHSLCTPHSVGIPGRVISPNLRPLPDKTQHSQHTFIIHTYILIHIYTYIHTYTHTPGRTRTRNPSTRAAADPHLCPRGYLFYKYSEELWDENFGQIYYSPSFLESIFSFSIYCATALLLQRNLDRHCVVVVLHVTTTMTMMISAW